MLLKTIRTPSQETLEGIEFNKCASPEEAIAYANKLKEEFFAPGSVRPVISHESVKQLGRIYDLYRVCPETRQIGDFAGDMNLPHNCVAVLIHKDYETDSNLQIEYITSDVEAYIVSDAGVTVTVINGKKSVDKLTLRSGSTTMLMEGGDIKLTTPHLNIHHGTTTSKSGPAK